MIEAPHQARRLQWNIQHSSESYDRGALAHDGGNRWIERNLGEPSGIEAAAAHLQIQIQGLAQGDGIIQRHGFELGVSVRALVIEMGLLVAYANGLMARQPI